MMDLSEIAREIFVDALDDCRIEQAFRTKTSSGIGDIPFLLRFADKTREPELLTDMSGVEHVFVVAAGTGAASMLQGLLETVRLPPNARLSGGLIAPQKPPELP